MISHKKDNKTFKFGTVAVIASVVITFAFVLCMRVNAIESNENPIQEDGITQEEKAVQDKESEEIIASEENEDLDSAKEEKTEDLNAKDDSCNKVEDEALATNDDVLNVEKEENLLTSSTDNYLEFYSVNEFKLDLGNLKTDGNVYVSPDASTWVTYTPGTRTSSVQASDNNYHVYMYIDGATYAKGDGEYPLGGILFRDASDGSDSNNLNVYCDGSISALVSDASKESCFEYLFCGCKSLKSAPDMSSINTIGKYGCQYMFANCFNLSNKLDLSSVTTINERGCYKMFQNSIISAPIDFSSVKNINKEGCLYMFESSKLSSKIDFSSVISVGDTGCKFMFSEAELSEAPDFSSLITIESYGFCNMFENATLPEGPSLKSLTIIGDSGCSYMFSGTKNLTKIPDMPALTTIKESGCYEMCKGNEDLEYAPNMPLLTTIEEYGCKEMFSGCKNIKNVSDLSALTYVGKEGCASMFNNCTGLKAPADLSSIVFAGQQAFEKMFNGCSNLEISESPTGALTNAWRIPSTATVDSNWNKDMFSGCAGTLTGDPEKGTSYYVFYTDYDAFKDYKAEKCKALDDYILPDDPQAIMNIVDAAKYNINTLMFDHKLDLATNKARIDVIFNKAIKDIDDYRRAFPIEEQTNNLQPEEINANTIAATGDAAQNVIIVLSCLAVIAIAIVSLRRQYSADK